MSIQGQIPISPPSSSDADKAFHLEQDIKNLKSDIEGNYIKMGGLLKDVRDNKYHTLLGFKSIGQWLSSPDISISPQWAWKAMAMYDTFIVRLGKKPEELKGIDYTKLGSVVSIIKKHPDEAEEWIEKANHLRRIDLQSEIKIKKISDRVDKIETLSSVEIIEGVFHGEPIEQVKKLVDNSVDLVITAPSPTTPAFVLQELFSEFRRVVKQNGSVFIFADFHNLTNLSVAMGMNDYHLIRDIVVSYQTPKRVVGVNTLFPYHELVLWGCRGDKPTYNLTEMERDIWPANLPELSDSLTHEMTKPLDIILQIIKMSSDKGQVVLDPFAGSGNILMAAKTLERNFVGIEQDELWYKLTLDKLKK